MDNIIDLSVYFGNQRNLQTRVEEAEVELDLRRSELQKYNDQMTEKLGIELSRGSSTGDPLQDSIICILGLNETAIERILAFSTQLETAKELFVAVPRQECIKHVNFPTPTSQNQYVTDWGYILGFLSGERLEIKRSTNGGGQTYTLVLPFRRYVKWNFKFKGGNTEVPVAEPLFAEENVPGDLGPSLLLLSLLEKGIGFRSCLTVVVDGAPLVDNSLESWKMTAALTTGRNKIQASTSDEQLAGAGI